MSTESTVAFFGLRIEVPEDQIEELEMRRHSLITSARSVSLQYYWANFGGIEPKYLFLIGKELAIIGIENETEFHATPSQIQAYMQDVKRKLQDAGFEQEPELILQFLPVT